MVFSRRYSCYRLQVVWVQYCEAFRNTLWGWHSFLPQGLWSKIVLHRSDLLSIIFLSEFTSASVSQQRGTCTSASATCASWHTPALVGLQPMLEELHAWSEPLVWAQGSCKDQGRQRCSCPLWLLREPPEEDTCFSSSISLLSYLSPWKPLQTGAFWGAGYFLHHLEQLFTWLGN